jgi:hypothetical protein
MPLLDRYDTPAGLRDAPEGSGFYRAWHEEVSMLVSGPAPDPGVVPEGRMRAPASVQRTADQGPASQWFDPLAADADVVTVRQLSWIGFPRESLTVDHRDDRAAAFAEAETRQQQHEYFEWRTYRDDTDRVTKVVFVTEGPEYWRVLAEREPYVLEALYQQLVSPDVRLADLIENGAYNPFNRWNTEAGIVHFVGQEPVNSLGAAIGLAQSGAGNVGFPDNYAMVESFVAHSVDDYLPLDVGAVMRKGLFVTVHDPVGLYIDGWDDTGWTTPDGSPVGDYWRIARGRPGAVLRLEYEVPQEEGFVVGDIRIGGRPITSGGQLAEHISVSLPVVVARSTS